MGGHCHGREVLPCRILRLFLAPGGCEGGSYRYPLLGSSTLSDTHALSRLRVASCSFQYCMISLQNTKKDSDSPGGKSKESQEKGQQAKLQQQEEHVAHTAALANVEQIATRHAVPAGGRQERQARSLNAISFQQPHYYLRVYRNSLLCTH